MSQKVIDNGPLMVQSSICSWKLRLKVYVHSVGNFSNKHLKISLLQMGFTFLCICIL